MKIEFTGTYTALITPFNKEDQSIDENTFKILVENQAKAGNHLVPVGTTGESPTLSHREHERVIEMTVEVAKNYDGIQIVAGIGSNNTIEAIQMTEFALQNGATAGLSVTPYYNKPTQEGHYQHQKKISEVGLPIILYNIPSRSGSGMSPETILKLAQLDNIVGLKAAAGVNDDLTKILLEKPDDFYVLSGDDTLTHYMIGSGANGVISVLSNLIPLQMNKYISKLLEGDTKKGLSILKEHLHLFKAIMSSGTNPEGIKESIDIVKNQLGVPHYSPTLRLPMMRLAKEDRIELERVVSHYFSTNF